MNKDQSQLTIRTKRIISRTDVFKRAETDATTVWKTSVKRRLLRHTDRMDKALNRAFRRMLTEQHLRMRADRYAFIAAYYRDYVSEFNTTIAWLRLPQTPDKIAAESAHVEYMSVEDGWHMLEARTRKKLGISITEFLHRYESGLYPDPDGEHNIMDIIMMLPFINYVDRTERMEPLDETHDRTKPL